MSVTHNLKLGKNEDLAFPAWKLLKKNDMSTELADIAGRQNNIVMEKLCMYAF